MSDDLLGSVEKWIESSGRALELRVARQFRQAGAAVLQSSVYSDAETGRHREADVVARFPWNGAEGAACRLVVAVECKNTQTPWVAFHDALHRSGALSLDHWTVYFHGSFTALTDPLAELWVGRPPLDQPAVATHLVSSHKGDHNPANDALRQVLSCADALRREYIATQSNERRAWVIMAAVVTTAPLVTCRLDSENRLQLAEVDHLSVWGYGPDGKRSQVFVLSERAVERFAGSLEQLTWMANA